ncbi:MAG: hypothetical protein LQ338_002052 [Usnochroma carphineum]|nr:MAG: hypothetical protein LQ338_002052 [Usnochroma carphineum]
MHVVVLVHLALASLSYSAFLPQIFQSRDHTARPPQLSSWLAGWTCTCCKPWARLQTGPNPFTKAKANSNDGIGLNENASKKESKPAEDIPKYVLDYAPLVHLFSGEKFWPCDIAEHLEHVTPYLNYTPIRATSDNMNVTNLDKLNEYTHGRFVYLTSDDNVEERPGWLGGEKNIPDDPEELYSHNQGTYRVNQRPISAHSDGQVHGGRSDAPAVLVVVNKGHGIVDAFWFFFYSYNLGNLVFNVRFGNHVGDWEHTLVRFHHGKPKFVFLSEHYFGQAYTYDAVEKIGKRPVVYSAVGTHAMYATPGLHPYVLPLGLLHDQTDRGPLWDPALNVLSYDYNHTSDVLHPSKLTPSAPTEWFYFNGHWGDRFYPLGDARQYVFAGQYHYVNGPLGPRWKHLGRRKVCQGRYEDPCVVRQWLPGEKSVGGWPEGEGEGEGVGEGEDWNGDERDPPGVEWGG